MMDLRTATATLRALAAGLVNVARGRSDRPHVKLVPGNVAPDFELPGSDGRTYRLSDFRDHQPVVLAWFPKAFTGGCTAECRSLVQTGDALRRLDVRVFAASVDDVETNTRFAESLGLDYPILSDPTRRVARAYGVLSAMGFASRWTFYIARDGRIADIDTRVSTATHGHDVAARLTALGLS